MRAWKVYVPGWGDEPQALVMASSRSRAHGRSLASATGAGYKLKWSDLRVLRAPQYDCWFEKHGAFSWSWQMVVSVALAMPTAPKTAACSSKN